MNDCPWLEVHPEVAAALRQGRPVVALESTLIAQGLPWPHNLKTARLAEGAVRGQGVVPATIAVMQGHPTVGLSQYMLEDLARMGGVLKASRRDLPAAIVQGKTAATTVAATMFLAHNAGIHVFATGGLGGVHRESARTWDISADLMELTRHPVVVVCAGVKSILDIPATLEVLEALGVPVLGYGTDEFPAFYLPSSGQRVPARVDSVQAAAAVAALHWNMGGAGVVLAQPVAGEVALHPEEFEAALAWAEAQAKEQEVKGPAVTPFLLARLADATKGKTLRANQSLVVANARLGARLARELRECHY